MQVLRWEWWKATCCTSRVHLYWWCKYTKHRQAGWSTDKTYTDIQTRKTYMQTNEATVWAVSSTASGFTNNPLIDSEEAVKTKKFSVLKVLHNLKKLHLIPLFLICAVISTVLYGTKGSRDDLDSLEECQFTCIYLCQFLYQPHIQNKLLVNWIYLQ